MSTIRIMLVEDDLDYRYLIEQALRREADFKLCTSCTDGKSAVQTALMEQPDIVLSDVMMPGMDGVECCRRLKGELQTCHIPVILLTACSLDEQRILGYDGGADSYISKPFNSQLLVSRVRNLIANRRQLMQCFGDNLTIEK